MSSGHERRVKSLERAYGEDDRDRGYGYLQLPPRLSPREWVAAVQVDECTRHGISSLCQRCGRPIGIKGDGSDSHCRVCDYIT